MTLKGCSYDALQLQLPIRREKEVKELKEKMKKMAPNDPSMEVLKKSLADLEVKKEDAASKVNPLQSNGIIIICYYLLAT